MSKISSIIYLIRYVLKLYGITVTRDKVYQVIYSDPSYLSFESVTNTFCYFGLYSEAYKGSIDDILHKNFILVHSGIDKEHFYLMKECNEETVYLYDGITHHMPLKQFMKDWDGIFIDFKGRKMIGHSFPFSLKEIFVVSLFLLLIVAISFSISYKIRTKCSQTSSLIA